MCFIEPKWGQSEAVTIVTIVCEVVYALLDG